MVKHAVITVQVFSRSSGNCYANAEVVLYPNSSGGGHRGYTGASGEAHFESLFPGFYEVSIGGTTVHKGNIEGRQVVYV
jgi:hypothetical protein